MAQSKEHLKGTYPLPAYNYRVDVGAATLSFSQLSGVAVEHSHVTYKHGYSYLEGESITQFHYEKFAPMTLRRGTVSGIEDLYEWLTERDLRTIDVSLCDEAGAPLVTWHIGKAVPIKLEAPAFDAASNDIAIESLDVMAANVSVEHHDGL